MFLSSFFIFRFSMSLSFSSLLLYLVYVQNLGTIFIMFKVYLMLKKLFGKTEKCFGIFTCLTFNTMKKIHLKQVYGKETKTGAGFLIVGYYNNNCFKKIIQKNQGVFFHVILAANNLQD